MPSSVLVESAAVPLPAAASRRRHYWIPPSLRGRTALWLIVAPAIVATTAAWAALLLVWSPLMDQFVWATRGVNSEQVFHETIVRILITTAILIVTFGVVALTAAAIVSHRVGGPLNRIGEVAVQVAQGRQHERVRLRDGDYIEDFAEQFNDMLDCMEARSRFHRNRMRAVQKNLSDLETALSQGMIGPEDLRDRLRESLRVVHDARTGQPEEETPVLY